MQRTLAIQNRRCMSHSSSDAGTGGGAIGRFNPLSTSTSASKLQNASHLPNLATATVQPRQRNWSRAAAKLPTVANELPISGIETDLQRQRT